MPIAVSKPKPLTPRVMAPVNGIVIIAVILMFGLAWVAEQIVWDQSNQVSKGAASALLTAQEKILGQTARALADHGGLGPRDNAVSKDLDFVMIIDAQGTTKKAWKCGAPAALDALGVIGPPLSQMVNSSLSADGDQQTQTGLGIVRGQLAILAVTPLEGEGAGPNLGDGSGSLLVLAHLLTAQGLADLGQSSGLPGLRFGSGYAVRAGANTKAIQVGNDSLAGSLIWQAPAHGATFRRLSPLMVTVGLLLVGLVVLVIGSETRDAKKLASSEARAYHLALHDPLTHFANRTLFMDSLQLTLAQLRRTGGQVAVLFINIDLFSINKVNS